VIAAAAIAAAGHSPGLTLLLAVLLAGASGALARTFVNDAIAHWARSDFPFGILSINVAGSFLLGLLTGLHLYHGLSTATLAMLGAGLCGGFTTWSTAIWESLQLLRLRLLSQATLYTLGGLLLAIAAAAGGIGIAVLT
jgi:CrcB protein